MDLERVGRCPVCDCSERASLHDVRDRDGLKSGAWSLWRCARCASGYLDPRPSRRSLGQAYAGDYYTHSPPAIEQTATSTLGRLRRSLRNGYLNHHYGFAVVPAVPGRLAQAAVLPFPATRALADRLVRQLALGSRLLDVGCGNGEFVAQAHAFGWAAAGIDVDERAIGFGRAAGLNVRADTVQEHSAANSGAYDAVTISHVLEHVPDPLAFLRTIHSLLRPGGWLWIATPNLDSLGHRIYGADWLGLDPPRHLVLFTADSLRTVVTEAGFDEVRDLPSTPAGDTFVRSSALRRSQGAGTAKMPRASTARILARAADLATRFHRRSGEELVVLARVTP